VGYVSNVPITQSTRVSDGTLETCPTAMPQIDFLPEKYRHRDVQRKNRWSRGVVVLLFIGLLVAGSLVLRKKRMAVATELDAARQTHDAVMIQTADLAKAVAQLSEARGQANLIAYLRHPWSRARIVAALSQGWPDALTLQELRICREAGTTAQPLPTVLAPTPDAQAAKPPALADLLELRRDLQNRPTVALLTGLMTDHAVLHRYLAELGKDDLFSNVELLGMAPAQAGGPLRFNVRLTVAPGYGQTGGPHAPPKPREAKSSRAHDGETATNTKQKPNGPTAPPLGLSGPSIFAATRAGAVDASDELLDEPLGEGAAEKDAAERDTLEKIEQSHKEGSP
jgi:hypothetical protein